MVNAMRELIEIGEVTIRWMICCQQHAWHRRSRQGNCDHCQLWVREILDFSASVRPSASAAPF
jgi:hypothetical protein